MVLVKMKLKKLVLFLFGFLGGLFSVSGQVIQSVGTAQAAQVTVFITDDAQQADLHVFRVDYKKDSKGNHGHWYFQDALTYADVKVYFTDTAAAAELLIYFVDSPTQARWLNRKKKQLLEK